MKSSSEIRKEFIEFFKQREHTVVTSAPVVPQADPTLLFVNAGMNQFKDVFLGTGSRDYTRAVNSQKCIRVSGKHNDLEDVGRDTYHHTFFEMLGNWSFGDYFKREAIVWAWELLTDVWGLPGEKLYATVHVDDDEAEKLWASETDVGANKIFRYDKDNFWEMGEIGPCGPCSEIHIDLDPGDPDHELAGDPKRGINSGSDRYVELWNLVFILFERQQDGSLQPLKEKHIDTGMGFERLCSVLQGSNSNFETDLFRPIMNRIADISGVEYAPGDRGLPHRVIADHTRMLTFSLTDGVVPSNEGRGYVLRRILRRAARYGRELGIREPFIHGLVGTVVDVMGEAFPEIVQRSQHVTRMIKAEEEGFGATLDRGIELFEEVAEKVKGAGENQIGGEDAFRLYDTYGFPIDLTELMAREKGLEVDREGFDSYMKQRREQSRADARFTAGGDTSRWAAEVGDRPTKFIGYDATEAEVEVLAADERTVILDRTPFYAESGGQVADTGTIEGGSWRFAVRNVQRAGGLVIHTGEFVEGSADDVSDGAAAVARVDSDRRLDTARNHTATHLLHRKLLEHLGEAATQAGSLVAPDYLRFDFHHYEKLPDEVLLEIERGVNAEIRADRTVRWFQQDYREAVDGGAMALFSEKYEDRVRVVEVDEFSRELCGGTHVDATGRIGAFVITQESSVAAGTRRIEALTGGRAADYLLGRSHLLDRVERRFSMPSEDLEKRLENLLEEQKALAKELEQARKAGSRAKMDDILADAAELPGGDGVLVARKVDGADMDTLKAMGDSFREKASSGAALFASVADGKLLFACAVTDDLAGSGKLKAGDIVGRVAKIAGGGGGGRPHLATAGGRDVEKLGEALDAFPEIVRELAG